jgi:RNA polymerase sigma-70 factor (ECF subfamily)
MGGSLFSILSDTFALSDEQAMLRVQKQNDPNAFAVLNRRWRSRIERLCGRLTGDAHRAEDIAQEAFTRIFVNRHQFRHDGKFSTYLWRVAVNACYDDQRLRRKRGEISLSLHQNNDGPDGRDLLVSAEIPPEAQAQKKEKADLVRRALMKLPHHYRSVLVLRHYEGLKFREIAQVLDIAEGTVKSRMAEALNRLERALTPTLGAQTHRSAHQA